MKINSVEWKNRVKEGAAGLQINLNQDALDLLAIHAEEMLLWNKKKNLTAITIPEEVAEKHVVDSVVLNKSVSGCVSLVDIGSGGGFPGIPLKILNQDLYVTLIDSSRKKISFLQHIIRKLKLTGIEAVHGRAEELHLENRFKGKYDVAVCRAFSSMDTFFSMAVPFINKDGMLIAMKGIENHTETDKLYQLICDNKDIYRADTDISVEAYRLPFSNSSRSLFFIKNILK